MNEGGDRYDDWGWNDADANGNRKRSPEPTIKEIKNRLLLGRIGY